MGSVGSLLQGVLFASMNTAITAYVAEQLHDDLGIGLGLLPRLLVFVFCLCLVLGSVLAESTTIRLDEQHGPIIGPIGTFLSAWLSIQVGAIIALMTGEYAILAPLAFAVAYAYGHAKAINHTATTFGPFLAAIALLFGLVMLLVDAEAVDEFADQIGDYFDLADSDRPLSYLMGTGGLFAIPGFVPVFVTMASFGLMRIQTPS